MGKHNRTSVRHWRMPGRAGVRFMKKYSLDSLARMLFMLAMTAGALSAQTNPSTEIVLKGDAQGKSSPLVHYWSKVVGAGRANEGLRSTWQEELQTVHRDAGFQYVRFHGLFHNDMFVYREDDQGRPVYNYQYVDDLFDRMLAVGVRPFVELGFVPDEMATAKATSFWWKANGGPPSDYAKWSDMVSHIVRHWVDRYGVEEVRQWYFEVWNEPNLVRHFFAGTQEQYFELYKVSARAVKGVDPALRVGGPATSNFILDKEALKVAQSSRPSFDPLSIPWKPIWIEEFLSYCKANQLPVDFVSTHPYPQDFAIEDGSPRTATPRFRRSIDSTRDDLRILRKIVNASPYPKAEIQLTEWSSSPSPLDHSHDGLAAAAFILKTNLDSVGLVDSLSYWVFTDVFEEERKIDSVFHGGFGMINYQQIAKPAFHAYRYLHQLGDEVISQGDGAILTRDHSSGDITALVYNYPPEQLTALPKTENVEEADRIDGSGSSRKVKLEISNLAPGALFQIEVLDREHGNAVWAWEQMGRPDPPSRAQVVELRRAALSTLKYQAEADSAGNLKIDRAIAPWSVILIRQARKQQ